jgi:hypothetical protein
MKGSFLGGNNPLRYSLTPDAEYGMSMANHPSLSRDG